MDNNGKNPKSQPKAAKPHWYGEMSGVNVWHATHESHAILVGKHLEDPSDDDLSNAIEEAKKRGLHAVVIHGAPPEKLRHKMELSKSKIAAGKTLMKSSVVEAIYLGKSFLQPDLATVTDQKAHIAALQTLPKSLLDWGHEKLSSLPKDAIDSFDLDGRTIKVRKLDADLYNGWVEHEGKKVHNFERVTLPELMIQLQSKLELYGKVEQVVSDRTDESAEMPNEFDFDAAHADFKNFIEDHLRSQGHSLDDNWWVDDESDDIDESDKTAVVERAKLKLKAIKEAKPDQIDTEAPGDIPDKVSIPKSDMVGGLLNPETECEDCGSPSEKCLCYSGLSKPRLEFDGKKVTIFFKSEWSNEDREAFIEDLKRRAGRIIKMERGTR
jgi:hypothetical protein